MTPEFYAADGMHLRTGTTAPSFPNDGFSNKANAGFDLPRDHGHPRSTLIPDARNDENLAVAQTHLAFIRFHNRVVNKLAAEACRRASASIRPAASWCGTTSGCCGTDFLPRITDKAQLKGVFDNGRGHVEPNPTPPTRPTMPSSSRSRPTASATACAPGVRVERRIRGRRRDAGLPVHLLRDERRPRLQNPLPSNWVADWRGLYESRRRGRT